MRLMTRASFRDAIRRDMGLPIASDRGGPIGDPAPTHPRPNNALINQKLSDAVEKFNLAGAFSVAQAVAAPLPATLSNGPVGVPLWTLGASVDLPQGAVTEVRRASWDAGSGAQLLRLAPASREALDRQRREVDNLPPAIPTHFYIEGNVLYVSPPPAAAGTLWLRIGTGVVDFDDDNDILEGLPAVLQVGIEYLAVTLIGLSQPTDPEMQTIAAVYKPQADEYLLKVEANRLEQNVMLQARAQVATYRRGGRW